MPVPTSTRMHPARAWHEAALAGCSLDLKPNGSGCGAPDQCVPIKINKATTPAMMVFLMALPELQTKKFRFYAGCSVEFESHQRREARFPQGSGLFCAWP